MRTWRLLLGLGIGLSSVGLWNALPAQAEAPVKPVEAAKPAGSTAKPAALSKAAAKPECKAGMVGIPAGTFTMGDADNTAVKTGTVTVAAFCMDRTEVTTAAYATCVKRRKCTSSDSQALVDINGPYALCGNGNCTYAHYAALCNSGIAGRGNHPIDCVLRHQAMAYCAAQGQRLPTVEEWEYAARGTDDRKYPWGNAEPSNQLCWNGKGNSLGKGKRNSTCPVASFPAGNSPFGLADMAGNVPEWTSSTWSEVDPTYVHRGGSWRADTPSDVRPAQLLSQDYPSIGFRCAGSEAAPSKAAVKPKCKSGMVGISTGTFTMGDETHQEKAGEVTVAGFCMDRTEVTTAAYATCIESGKCTASTTHPTCNAGIAGRGNHPINCVDWPQATAYCEAQGQRLPTEEEWEYAARGTDDRKYPWGNAEPSNQLCWNGKGNNLGQDKRQSTCVVGSFPKSNSPFGLADMAGNVWEWTSSTHIGDTDSRASRVYRGGDWKWAKPNLFRSTIRGPAKPSHRGNNVGFRCAVSPFSAGSEAAPSKTAALFAAPVRYATGSFPQSVTAGDWNGDKKLDLATANTTDYNISILLGNGNGTFQAKVDYATGAGPNTVMAGDWNGDGNPDLATTNYIINGTIITSSLSILLGNGNGTFQTNVDYGVGSFPHSVTAGDWNGDKKADFAVANHDGNVSILLGNGNGTFQAKVDYATGLNSFLVTAGDWNGDGKPDLAVANHGSRNVSILLGNGNGTFQPKVDYGAGNSPESVTAGDWNGDGKLDLATANYYSGNVSILLGNGNGTFQAAVGYATGAGPNTVMAGDWNGDGKLDLATTKYGNVSILLGNGNGTFQAKVDYGVGLAVFSLTAGDWNGDGKPDLAVANSSNDVSILLNTSQ